MRRYAAPSYRGRWYIDHDSTRNARRWTIWLLRELGIPVRVGRPRKRV